MVARQPLQGWPHADPYRIGGPPRPNPLPAWSGRPFCSAPAGSREGRTRRFRVRSDRWSARHAGEHRRMRVYTSNARNSQVFGPGIASNTDTATLHRIPLAYGQPGERRTAEPAPIATSRGAGRAPDQRSNHTQFRRSQPRAACGRRPLPLGHINCRPRCYRSVSSHRWRSSPPCPCSGPHTAPPW